MVFTTKQFQSDSLIHDTLKTVELLTFQLFCALLTSYRSWLLQNYLIVLDNAVIIYLLAT